MCAIPLRGSGLAILMAAASLTNSATAGAQAVATTFEELRARLEPQTIVEVTRTDGTRVEGSIEEITTDRLRLAVDGRDVELEEGAVRRLERRRSDSVLNGVLIGAGAGALLGLIPTEYDDCDGCRATVYASTVALSAGVGLLVDALRHGHETLYESRGGTALRLDLALTPRTVGFAATLRLR